MTAKVRRIAYVVRKIPLKSLVSDKEYWLSKPASERIQVVEDIRREYHTWRGDAQQGLQRVYRIIKQTSS